MKDMATGEILSNQISDTLELQFVHDTLKDLEKFHLK
jgi:hypothetical protein